MNGHHEHSIHPPSADAPPPRARGRRGVALLTAILAVVVISVLVLGGLFASTQEYRGGRNLLTEQRAFAVAEYGLNYDVSNWDGRRNISMKVGEIDSTKRYPADADTAYVKVTKLTETTFWVVSEGRASMGGAAAMESGRRTNAFVRLAYPTIKPEGAITTAGDLETKGNFTVTGNNTNPPGWENPLYGDVCTGIPDEDVDAIRHAPGVTIKIHKSENVIGGVVESEEAAKPETYISYGSETWESLVANADIRISKAAGNPFSNVGPVGTATSCTNDAKNWGEPERPGTVKGCYHRFPIIYAEDDLHINSNGRGQGILLVNGNLFINGNFKFHGIIIARDNVDTGNGTAEIYGAIYARDADLGETYLSGNQSVYYSRCAIENALRGSAILTRVKERHWTQLF